MSLKSTGLLRQAFIGVVFAIVFIGSQAFWLTYLISRSDWTDLWGPQAYFFAVPMLILSLIDIAFVAAPILLYWQWRGLRCVPDDLERVAPRATMQPDYALALQYGETITLRRTPPLGAIFRQMAAAIFVLLILAAFLEGVVLYLLPSINPAFRSFNSFVPDPPPASTLHSVIGAYVPILTLITIVAALLQPIMERLETITADDHGVTVSRSLRRARFIAWSEITLLIQPLERKSGRPIGAYFLWGERQFFPLMIRGKAMTTIGAERTNRVIQYEYTGGYETYLRDARRLIATISVRSHAPLRTLARNTRAVARVSRRFPLITLDLDAALVAPHARPEEQPTLDAIRAAHTSTTSLRLGERISGWSFAAETLIFLVLLLGFTATHMWIVTPTIITNFTEALFSINYADPIQLVVVIIASAYFSAVMLLMSLIIPLARRVSRFTRIVVDGDGIAITALGAHREGGRIAWRDVRAWVVVHRGAGSHANSRYAVLSDEHKLVWIEPVRARLAGRAVQGDRREVYRARAVQLHAMIAARTGLPLREIRLDDLGKIRES